MRNPRQLDDKEYLVMVEDLKVQCKAEQLFGMDWYNPTCYALEILDAKYGKVSMDDVVDQLTHLNDKQKQDLKVLFKDFLGYLTAHLEGISIKSFISTQFLVQNLNIVNLMQYPAST